MSRRSRRGGRRRGYNPGRPGRPTCRPRSSRRRPPVTADGPRWSCRRRADLRARGPATRPTKAPGRAWRCRCAGCAPSKRNSVLVAAREPFRPSFPTSELTGYEHCCVQASFEALELLGFHFPLGDAKGPLFEWLLHRKRSLLGQAALLIGDFNTGIHHVDEAGATFDHADKFAALQNQGWIDLWRTRNRIAREFSWFSTQGNGFGLDHALASPVLDADVRSAYYSHIERESGISDHAIMCVEFAGGCPTSRGSQRPQPASIRPCPGPLPRAGGKRPPARSDEPRSVTSPGDFRP